MGAGGRRRRHPAARPTSVPTARSSRATCTRRSPACSRPVTWPPPATRCASCSSASSCPTARCPRNSLVNGKHRARLVRRPARRGGLPDPDGLPVGLTDGRSTPTTSSGPRTSWSRTVRRSAPSGGRSRAATHRRRSPPRSPGWSRPARSPTSTATPPRARIYRATADHYQRSIKGWTVTTTGPLRAPAATSSGCPRTATRMRRSPTTSATAAPTPTSARSSTPGSWSCPGSGILPADDPDVAADAAGRRRRRSARHRQRARVLPLRHRDTGHRGRLRRLLRARRHRLLARRASRGRTSRPGHPATCGRCWRRARRAARCDRRRGDGAPSCCSACSAFASGIGLIPEQAWENPDLPASPFGTDPESASIGFENGEAAGTASPLTWSAARSSGCSPSIGPARPSSSRGSTASATSAHTQPAETPVTVTAPGRRRHGDHRDGRRHGDHDARARRSTSPPPNTDGDGADHRGHGPRRRRRRRSRVDRRPRRSARRCSPSR